MNEIKCKRIIWEINIISSKKYNALNSWLSIKYFMIDNFQGEILVLRQNVLPYEEKLIRNKYIINWTCSISYDCYINDLNYQSISCRVKSPRLLMSIQLFICAYFKLKRKLKLLLNTKDAFYYYVISFQYFILHSVKSKSV